MGADPGYSGVGSCTGPPTETRGSAMTPVMQCLLAAFATSFTRTVRPGCQTTSSRVRRQGVHVLGAVRGHAVLPGGAFELAARSLPGAGWMRIAAEASGHRHRAEEIDPGLCQRQSPLGTLPVDIHSVAGQVSGRDSDAQLPQVSFQEQADEPGWQHHASYRPPCSTGPSTASGRAPSSYICCWTTTAICPRSRS